MGEISLVASIGFMPFFYAIRFQGFGRGQDSGGEGVRFADSAGHVPGLQAWYAGRRTCGHTPSRAARGLLSRTITILTRGRGDEKEKNQNQTNRRGGEIRPQG